MDNTLDWRSFTQYRFFKNASCEDHQLRNLKVAIPALDKLFEYTDEPAGTIDVELFCHELAHAMDLVSRGRQNRLFLENFGWDRFTPEVWTRKMVENEVRVFAYQWYLMKVIDPLCDIDAGVLGPSIIVSFFKVVSGIPRAEVEDMIKVAIETQESNSLSLVKDTVEYIFQIATKDTNSSVDTNN